MVRWTYAIQKVVSIHQYLSYKYLYNKKEKVEWDKVITLASISLLVRLPGIRVSFLLLIILVSDVHGLLYIKYTFFLNTNMFEGRSPL